MSAHVRPHVRPHVSAKLLCSREYIFSRRLVGCRWWLTPAHSPIEMVCTQSLEHIALVYSSSRGVVEVEARGGWHSPSPTFPLQGFCLCHRFCSRGPPVAYGCPRQSPACPLSQKQHRPRKGCSTDAESPQPCPVNANNAWAC